MDYIVFIYECSWCLKSLESRNAMLLETCLYIFLNYLPENDYLQDIVILILNKLLHYTEYHTVGSPSYSARMGGGPPVSKQCKFL